MEEKIAFQCTRNQKIYRRVMIFSRVILTLLVTGAMCGIMAVAFMAGLMLAVIALFAGAISIVVSLNNSVQYAVYNTQIVIRKRDERKFIPMKNVRSVTCKRAFYEKDRATATVTIKATGDNGRLRTYRLYHILEAEAVTEYIRAAVSGESEEQ